jgi:hypothetical protein
MKDSRGNAFNIGDFLVSSSLPEWKIKCVDLFTFVPISPLGQVSFTLDQVSYKLDQNALDNSMWVREDLWRNNNAKN